MYIMSFYEVESNYERCYLCKGSGIIKIEPVECIHCNQLTIKCCMYCENVNKSCYGECLECKGEGRVKYNSK